MKIPRVVANIFGGKEREYDLGVELPPNGVRDATLLFAEELLTLSRSGQSEAMGLERRLKDRSVHTLFIEKNDKGIFNIVVIPRECDNRVYMVVIVGSENFVKTKDPISAVVMSIAQDVNERIRNLAFGGRVLHQGDIDSVQMLTDAGILGRGEGKK